MSDMEILRHLPAASLKIDSVAIQGNQLQDISAVPPPAAPTGPPTLVGIPQSGRQPCGLTT